MSQGTQRLPAPPAISDGSSAAVGGLRTVRTAGEEIILHGLFHRQIPSRFRRDSVASEGDYVHAGGGVYIGVGTALGYREIHGDTFFGYSVGAVLVYRASIALPDTGAPGCLRTWGLLGPGLLNGYVFRLNGTTLQAVRVDNGVEDTKDAAEWTEKQPTVDTKLHTWEIKVQTNKVTFLIDGEEVHIMTISETDMPVTVPSMTAWHRVENTTEPQADPRSLFLGEVAVVQEGSLVRDRIRFRYRINSEAGISAGGSGFAPVMALRVRREKNGVPVYNRVRIRRILISTDVGGIIRMKTNAQITGATIPDNRPNPPDTEWSGHTTPIIATASATDISVGRTGYAASDSLGYKITAIGVLGETQASTYVGSASAGSPAKQIDITWNPITFAAGYEVYRSVNGGTYYRVAETSDTAFTDDAYTASAETAPVSNTAEGDSAVESIEAPSSIVGGRGISFFPVGSSGAGPGIASLELTRPEDPEDDILLRPGETFSIEFDPDTGTANIGVTIDWDEEEA